MKRIILILFIYVGIYGNIISQENLYKNLEGIGNLINIVDLIINSEVPPENNRSSVDSIKNKLLKNCHIRLINEMINYKTENQVWAKTIQQLDLKKDSAFLNCNSEFTEIDTFKIIEDSLYYCIPMNNLSQDLELKKVLPIKIYFKNENEYFISFNTEYARENRQEMNKKDESNKKKKSKHSRIEW